MAHKDRAAALWCENATRLTGTNWVYFRANQPQYQALRPNALAEWLAVAGAAGSEPEA
ncbi:MAG: hypothetical protein HPY83_02425 [Anaerolineae bacterium]|nr:hypothetical protein [Anaerolineae bacterium]